LVVVPTDEFHPYVKDFIQPGFHPARVSSN
jgi:hypothetical protein